MTKTSAELIDLASRVEGLTGPDRELEEVVYAALGNCNHKRTQRYVCQSDSGFTCLDCGKDTYGADRAPRYTASLDAAMSLVPEGWEWAAGTGRREHMTENGRKPWAWCANGTGFALPLDFSLAATPALALTAACLRALASKGQTHAE